MGGGYSLVRVALGAILLVAAGLKAHQLATDPFVTFAPSYLRTSGDADLTSPLPLGEGRVRAALAPHPSSLAPLLHLRPFLIGIVEFELLLGLLLVSGIFHRLTWPVSLLCFGGFAVVSLSKGLSGDASCGCFGRVAVNPWYTLGLDAGGVLALLRWRPRGVGSIPLMSPWQVRVRAVAVAVVWLLAGVPAAFAVGTRRPSPLSEVGDIVDDEAVVVLEPKKWIGRRCPLLDYIADVPGTGKPGQQPLRERLVKGEWVVVLYHHDCRKCIEGVRKYERLARRLAADPTGPEVALIEVPPFGDRDTPVASSDTPCALGRLDGTKVWFVDTLASFTLRGGNCTCDGKDGLVPFP